LLLTTTGAKSGQRRTSPMMYLADQHDPDRVYVFASAGGADQNPAWYHNVVAHPDDLRVEIGSEELDATAEVLQEPERSDVYAIQAGRYPGFADYQTSGHAPAGRHRGMKSSRRLVSWRRTDRAPEVGSCLVPRARRPV
jgi:deazaflavin-dependent oxidoreductase (nitroreductase family)